MIGNKYERADLVHEWGAGKGGEDDWRCFFSSGNTIALFVTQENRGTPWSKKTYVNFWNGPLLSMEVNANKPEHNQRLGKAGAGEQVGVLYRQRTGEPFQYKGLVEFKGETELAGSSLFNFRLLP